MKRKMKEWYEIKDRGIMGSGDGEIKEVTILGRLLRWTEDGLEYEADPKHVRDLMEEEGLEDESKTVVSPAVKPRAGAEDQEVEELGREEAKGFRGGAAKLNYLGHDRPDLQYATKEICRYMVKPRFGMWKNVECLRNYFLAKSRAMMMSIQAVNRQPGYRWGTRRPLQ